MSEGGSRLGDSLARKSTSQNVAKGSWGAESTYLPPGMRTHYRRDNGRVGDTGPLPVIEARKIPQPNHRFHRFLGGLESMGIYLGIYGLPPANITILPPGAVSGCVMGCVRGRRGGRIDMACL